VQRFAPPLGAPPQLAQGIVVLYMIIEHFKNDDPVPVYRRFRDRGRLAPDGLQYISSWVDEKLERCFQIMETDDRKLLDQWITNWSDIVEFEVFPVVSSKEATERIAPRL
jgi:Domain of unknown function (DUF3303)